CALTTLGAATAAVATPALPRNLRRVVTADLILFHIDFLPRRRTTFSVAAINRSDRSSARALVMLFDGTRLFQSGPIHPLARVFWGAALIKTAALVSLFRRRWGDFGRLGGIPQVLACAFPRLYRQKSKCAMRAATTAPVAPLEPGMALECSSKEPAREAFLRNPRHDLAARVTLFS